MKKLAVIIAAVLLLTGCPAALSALDLISRGAQYLGTVLDVAKGGADAFSARHPNQERDEKIAAADRRARQALAVLEGALATGDAVAAEDVEKAKREALAAYGELRALLDEAGVLSAKAPAGGAETEAPKPEPVALPSVDDVAARLQ